MFMSIGFLLGHSHGIPDKIEEKKTRILSITKRAERKLCEQKKFENSRIEFKTNKWFNGWCHDI